MPIFDPRSTLRPLRHRAFALYMGGNSVSLLGNWMQRVAVGWLAWELTESGAWLGIVAAAEFLPTLLVAPLAGAAADRWDRLMVMKVSQAIMMVLAFLLFAITVSGLITIWYLLVLNTLLGTVGGFVHPARMAFVPSLVPRPELGGAVAINSLNTNISRLIAPMIAGLIIVKSGAGGVFLYNGLSFAFFIFVLSKLPAPTVPKSKAKSGLLGELKDGVRYTVSHTGIAAVLLLLIAMSLGARPLIQLLPGFAGAVFDNGAIGLAIMNSSIAAGGIVGALWVSSRPIGAGYFNISLIHSSVLALSVMAFAVTDLFWLALIFIVLYGFTSSVAHTCMQTSVQLAVDQSMAGRVLSLYGLIFRSAPALGALLIGAASERFGLQAPMCAAGLVIAAVCVHSFVQRQKIIASLEARPPTQV